MTDNDLIELLSNGNNEAFRLFIDTYNKLVFRTCYNMLRNTEDAEDITQEVFVEVFESIHLFRNESKLSTWVCRIAINKSLNQIRKNRFKKLIQSIEGYFIGEKNTPLEISDESPSTLENSERRLVLQKAIDSLPENQRIAFILTKYDDRSYQETADIMNLSLASIESLIFRAKQNLQKKLLHYYKS